MDIQWKKQITKSFSLNGFSIKADAMKHIINLIKSNGYENDISTMIDEIIKNLDKSQLNNNIIDLITIENCLKLINTLNNSEEIEKEALKILDAFDTPLFNYDSTSKQFIKCENYDRSLHGSSRSKSELYRKRYQKVLQRTERNEYFTAPILAKDKLKKDSYQTITPLSSLLGNTGRKHVLGTISQIEEDQLYIEDLNTRVKIDISNAKFEFGLVTINSIIQASGEYIDSIFIADKIQLPITEERNDTLKFLQNIDMFGTRPSNKKTLEQLEKYEMEKQDNSILFLSDVWLDSERVLERLDYLFDGYKDCPPFAIVLMGNFTEHPLINGAQYNLKNYFNNFANLIQKYQTIHEFTNFIFVPGPTDPTGSLLNILPKFPIPNVFVKEFINLVPKSTFTTNPCRLRYCTKEILLFRDDLTSKMRRHCILEPSESADISQHLIELIFSNSHLCNLTLEDKPIYWNYDHAMSVYPLPNLMVIGDKSNQYEHSRDDGTLSINPSSFSTDYSFTHYVPAESKCYFNKVEKPHDEYNDDGDEQEEQQEEKQKEQDKEIKEDDDDDNNNKGTQPNGDNDDDDDDDDNMVSIDENEKQKKTLNSKKQNRKKVELIENPDEYLNKLEDDQDILDEQENENNNQNVDDDDDEYPLDNEENIISEVLEVEKEEDEDDGEDPNNDDNENLDSFVE